MKHALRHRFWVEAVLGGMTAILAIVTLVWHDWIEAVFGVDPDHGDGSVELLVVLVLLLVTLGLGIAARLEWHRAWRAET
jgi:hypothetical protein